MFTRKIIDVIREREEHKAIIRLEREKAKIRRSQGGEVAQQQQETTGEERKGFERNELTKIVDNCLKTDPNMTANKIAEHIQNNLAREINTPINKFAHRIRLTKDWIKAHPPKKCKK